MTVHEISFSEAMSYAGSAVEENELLIGFRIVRGMQQQTPEIDSQTLQKWFFAIKPNTAKIAKAIETRVDIDNELSIPIGLSIITGKAGSGKTSWLRESLTPAIPELMTASFLKIGEPGYLIPYTLATLLNVIKAEVMREEQNQDAVGILMIDSLLSVWFDPLITRGFGIGKGGASLGVPMLLQIIGQYALAHGFRIVAVLHPIFADPEVIGSGISGVSSMFINRDTGSYIVRDYEQIEPGVSLETVGSLSYTRKEANMMTTLNSALSLLTQTIGDED